MTTVLVLCTVSFLAGLAIGMLLDEARRLVQGVDDVATLTRSGSWRPWAIGGVLAAMLLNGWGAYQLVQSRHDVQQLQSCSSQSTAAAIELWEGLHELLAENPQARDVTRLIEVYLNSLHELQGARQDSTELPPCQH